MISRLFTNQIHQRTLSILRTTSTRRSPILLRTFSSEPVAANERPLNEVYYHLVKAPSTLLKAFNSTKPNSSSVFAVSFLPTPPTVGIEKSKTVLGVIPALEGEEGEPGLNDFVQNPLFLAFLHDTLKSALKDGVDEAVAAEALQRKSGWMHIQDERNIPALGRIGDPDDILASVMVEDGKILPETYQVMPSYRIFTADGPPRLSLGLAQRLEEALQNQLRLEID